MRHIAINSSHIASAAHDSINDVLEITFVGGRTYKYRGVPAAIFNKMVNHETPGSYFHEAIKPHYRATEVTNDL